jgi:hypothetical protein
MHAIWNEEAVSVSSFIHFTANLTSSRLPFQIVELVQNVGFYPVEDEKQAPFTGRQKIWKQRRGSS